jgi:hypothetical protein
MPDIPAPMTTNRNAFAMPTLSFSRVGRIGPRPGHLPILSRFVTWA